MSGYAIVDPTGLVIGREEGSSFLNAVNGGGAFGTVVLIQEGATVTVNQTALIDNEFVSIPPRPAPWATWSGSEWIDPRTPEDHARELATARQTAIREITAIRGAARLAYITDLPGQDMLYMAKMEEARAFIAEAEPDPADYPLIASEVGVTAPTAEEVAQVFLNLNALWRLAAGAIDAACFGAEAAVYAATTATEIDAALIALAAQLALNA